MRRQVSEQTFDELWCLRCGNPKKMFDPSLKLYSCRCDPNEVARHKFFVSKSVSCNCKCAKCRSGIHYCCQGKKCSLLVSNTSFFGYRVGFVGDTPFGLNTGFAVHERCFGLESLVLHPTRSEVIGYVFPYELDYSYPEIEKHSLEVHSLSELIARFTGTCIVRRSQHGWHFASINIIPFNMFRALAEQCQQIAPSNYRYLVLRLSQKANENFLPPINNFYTCKSPYPVSRRHRELWELVTKSKLIHQQQEVEARVLHIKYHSWG